MAVAESRRHAFAIGSELVALYVDVSVFQGLEQPCIGQRIQTLFPGIVFAAAGACFVRKANRAREKAIVVVTVVGIQGAGKILRGGRLKSIASSQ